jgi:ABC-2 type transport system ATP-binding protein
MFDPILFRNVTKSYPGFVLEDISFSIAEGRIVGLLGVNGAGKSTLLKCAMRFVHADSGEVVFPTHDGTATRQELCRIVGYVPESPTFYEWMTVGRLIRFVSSFFPSWDKAREGDLLRRYRLDLHAQVKTLSHGMRAKLSLLIAMTHRPGVLLLDEPTSGLDPVMRAGFLAELSRLVDEREVKAILFSSHILAEVAEIASDIAVLRGGKLVSYTTTQDLVGHWGRVTFTLQRVGGLPASVGGGRRPLGGGRSVVVVENGNVDPTVQHLRSIGATDVTVERAEIQEILLALMQDEEGG